MHLTFQLGVGRCVCVCGATVPVQCSPPRPVGPLGPHAHVTLVTDSGAWSSNSCCHRHHPTPFPPPPHPPPPTHLGRGRPLRTGARRLAGHAGPSPARHVGDGLSCAGAPFASASPLTCPPQPHRVGLLQARDEQRPALPLCDHQRWAALCSRAAPIGNGAALRGRGWRGEPGEGSQVWERQQVKIRCFVNASPGRRGRLHAALATASRPGALLKVGGAGGTGLLEDHDGGAWHGARSRWEPGRAQKPRAAPSGTSRADS
jgi:hypothetical protein